MDIISILQNPTIIWIAIAVAFAIVEACTMGLTCIWFTAGAALAAVVSILGLGLPIQIGAFVLASIILLIATRPLARKYVNSRITATNINALIGQQALVVERISEHAKGRVKLEGKLWSAQLAADSSETAADKGCIVEVVELNGVTLIVKHI